MRTNIVQFDDLVGARSDPATLFTCERHFPRFDRATAFEHTTSNRLVIAGNASTASAQPGAPPSTAAAAPSPRSAVWLPSGDGYNRLELGDVAVALPVSGKWLTPRPNSISSTSGGGGVSHESPLLGAARACAEGSVLACARHTWMAAAGPSLDVLLMADCLPLCQGGAADGQNPAGCRLNTNSWQHDSAFEFEMLPWLRPHAALAKLEARCFWAEYKGLGLSWRKTSAMIMTLLARFPTKTYYLKADADAILRPNNLMHFLRFLHREVDPRSPIYFGTAFGTYNCTDDPSDNCRSFTFNKGASLTTDRWGQNTRRRVRLRETADWLKLERQILEANLGDGWEKQQAVENRTAVMCAAGGGRSPSLGRSPLTSTGAPPAHFRRYAMGGVYGMSRLAAQRLVRSSCQAILGSLYCQGCARNVLGKGVHTHEDANLGLCMHLNQVLSALGRRVHPLTSLGGRTSAARPQPPHKRVHAPLHPPPLTTSAPRAISSVAATTPTTHTASFARGLSCSAVRTAGAP